MVGWIVYIVGGWMGVISQLGGWIVHKGWVGRYYIIGGWVDSAQEGGW